MKKALFLLVVFTLCAVDLHATIHNVPVDYGSIQEAIDASVNTDTVLVEQNTYFENIDFKGKNIVLGSLFLITQDTSHISRTIIDGSANGSVVTFKSNEDSTAMLIGFTIRNGKNNSGGGIYIQSANPTVSNCIIRNNIAESTNGLGGGIYIRESRSLIFGCEIMYNAAIGEDNNNGWGGGIAVLSCDTSYIINCKIHHNQATYSRGGVGLTNSKAKIIGCEITNNYSYGGGSGVGFQDSDLTVVNCTIADNKVDQQNGSALYFIRSSPVIYNCIIWHNKSDDIYKSIHGWGGAPEIFYSNIQGGYDTLLVMDLEPMFVDTTSGDFRLTGDSPCIDAGDPDTSGLNLPMIDLDGNVRVFDGKNDGNSIIDMGAYEFGSLPLNVENKMIPNRPTTFQLKQNYPNPFNSATTFQFYANRPGPVNLQILNIRGQVIKSWPNLNASPGWNHVRWNGENNMGESVASGVYFYRAEAGGVSQWRKMTILK